jgi:hypothetical protein
MNTALFQYSINTLLSMSYAELVRCWQTAFHHPPPPQCGKALMRGALAWNLQVNSLGGLSPSEFKVLRQSASSPTQILNLPVGSRLVRVWQGNTHQVTVLDMGFEYSGKRWASLSAIAQEITSTRWSGPVFFGIKKGGGR